jgi:hypothetical protein
MKKIIGLLAVVLMIASVAVAADVISTKNLASLKGTWEGMLSWGIMGAANSNAKLEILNDTVPVSVKLTLTNVPDAVAQRMGWGSTGGTKVIESSEGEITNKGTLFIAGGEKNFMELSLSGAKKLKGSYLARSVKGDINLSKK